MNSKRLDDIKRIVKSMKTKRLLLYPKAETTFLVENYEDINFWKAVISLSNYKKTIDFRPIFGKGDFVYYKEFVAEDFKIGRDADMEYVYAENWEYEKAHIHHTYLYSIENFICQPTYLDILLSELCFSPQTFWKDFLQQFSRTVYELFLCEIALKMNGIYDVVTIQTWESLIAFDKNISLAQYWQNLETQLSQIIDNAISYLYEYDKNFYINLLQDKYGVHSDNCFGFIQGHALLDKLIVPLFIAEYEKITANISNKEQLHAINRWQNNANAEKLAEILRVKITDHSKSVHILHTHSNEWISKLTKFT